MSRTLYLTLAHSTVAYALSAAPAGASASQIDLGGGRSLTVFTPTRDADAENEAIAAILGLDQGTVSGQRSALSNFDDAEGQKLWPASRALARLLAQPAGGGAVAVKDLAVIELGCGVGAVGITAALAGAKSVLLTDFQPKSLELAKAAAAANGVGNIVRTQLLDWRAPSLRQTCEELSERLGPFDLLLGSDILYDKELTSCLMEAIDALLNHKRERSRPESRAVLIDPPMRPCRALLPELCAARGLYWGGEAPVPEAEQLDTVLINILRG
eukprot:CAMPEP_0183332638 /NCGR_PEP_ID=MMETSP0164_2-20130417/1751_1 /TAXON_ID=221442 /ORGANISM="Coccolithus pelagicus ssp braarudi, Strain PLY182g" /LENGTH=270 /DNA_ID=CAMNT_0025501395 /DNA_START=50 /DNA_END=862 /DNA_ORIENTATION=+